MTVVRLAVVSDVHGNLHALRATIDRLRRHGVDEWVSAGDVVGYGAHPGECLDLLAGLGAHGVAGNHELMVLGHLSTRRAGRLAQETTGWTRSALGEDRLRQLAMLPAVLQRHGVVVAHGSLSDPELYVRGAEQAAAQLDLLDRDFPGSAALVLGHTHHPLVYDRSRGLSPAAPGATVRVDRSGVLLNPGSVGQSRERERVPLARSLVLDLEGRSARFFSVPYDVAACRAALRAAGLPRRAAHLRPRRSVALVRRVARGVSGVRE